MQPSGPLTGAPLGFPQGTATPLQYTVGPEGSVARFRRVQDAIDAAVADGASGLAPRQVLVLPGDYPEDVSMRAGVPVKGFSGSAIRILGTVTIDLEDQGGLDATSTSLANVTVEAPPGQPALWFTGSVAQTAFIVETQLFAFDQPVVVADNTGMDGGDSSFLATSQVLLEFLPGGGASPMVSLQAGSAAFTLAQMSGDRTADVLLVDNGAFFIGLEVRGEGRLNVLDGFAFLESPQIEVLGQPALSIGAAAFVIANFPVLGTDTGPAVDGAGAFGYDVISYANGGAGIDPTVTIAGPIPVQAIENTLYAADPVEWVGPPPVFVGQALDRMVDLLVALNAGPIP